MIGIWSAKLIFVDMENLFLTRFKRLISVASVENLKEKPMSKIIENKADRAFPYANDTDASVSSYAERRAYIKGYEEALADVKRHLNIAAIAGKRFMVLDMYKWIDKRLKG